MALHQRAFDILSSLAPCRLLSLGVPDLLLTTPYDIPEVPNADNLRMMHNWRGPIYQTDLVFKHHGIEATYLDNQAWTGREVVADLNEDFTTDDGRLWRFDEATRSSHNVGPFDVVLDPGTIEHVFNIGQAFVNVRNLCRPGGHIIHTNPMNIPNHGFFSLSPTAYADWYQHHSDILLNVTAITGDGKENYALQVRRRFNFPIHAWMFVVVRRSDVPTLSQGWPTQFKYLTRDERDERKARGQPPATQNVD